MFDEIPTERWIAYSLREVREYEVHGAMTNRFVNTFFLNTLYEWNFLGEEIKKSLSLSQFRSKVLKIIRSQKKSTYNICDITGEGYLIKLRFRLSMLYEHNFRRNFDSLTHLCACGMDTGDIEHVFLHCF